MSIEIEHAGLGSAYLRSHPDVPIAHDIDAPCAYCDPLEGRTAPHVHEYRCSCGEITDALWFRVLDIPAEDRSDETRTVEADLWVRLSNVLAALDGEQVVDAFGFHVPPEAQGNARGGG